MGEESEIGGWEEVGERMLKCGSIRNKNASAEVDMKARVEGGFAKTTRPIPQGQSAT